MDQQEDGTLYTLLESTLVDDVSAGTYIEMPNLTLFAQKQIIYGSDLIKLKKNGSANYDEKTEISNLEYGHGVH